ncbi:MAG: hypothetical protein Q9227_001913 [Pyrenula ochraceoflavens]
MDAKSSERIATVEMEDPERLSNSPIPRPSEQDKSEFGANVEIINASGHKQELDRNFGIWSICNLSIALDNAWGAVYHWASVTGGPRYGRICSWYAGWWNFFAWTVATASDSLFAANAIIGIYNLYHPDYKPQRWQIFIVYVIVTWMTCSVVLFAQRVIAHVSNFCGILVMALWFASTMVCAIMPSFNGHGHASNSFVWLDWNNMTGYSSNGFVFLAGMLNGAFTIGTPDGCTHLAEEIPDPKRNIPKGILAQLTAGFITPFLFFISLLYAITDLDKVMNSNLPSLPLAAIYEQATRSRGGTTALLVMFILETLLIMPSVYIAAGRMLWTLARDDAVPFSRPVAHVSHRFRNPFTATVIVGICSTLLGCIYLGSSTAFNAFVGSFIILTTLSYLAPILPHLLSRRRFIKPGPFWMPNWAAYPVLITTCLFITVFDVIWMFPFTLPVSAEEMNYSCVLTGGFTIFISLYYLWKRNHGYRGPQVVMEIEDDEATAMVRETHEGKDIRLPA